MFLTKLFEDPAIYLMVVLAVILSIVLHELGHALAATWEGDATPAIRGHLTWNPVVHMGWLALAAVAVVGIGWGETPVTPQRFRHRRWGDVIVSFAGPAVHILLAVVSAAMVGIVERSGVGGGEVRIYVEGFWRIMVNFNAMLLLFNMLPVPPFDGFRVLGGIFDLGELGVKLRQMHPFPFIIAWVLVANGVIPLWQIAGNISTFLIATLGGDAGSGF